jgi:hypothetical protein
MAKDYQEPPEEEQHPRRREDEPSLSKCSNRSSLPEAHSMSISRPIRPAVAGGRQGWGSKKIGVTEG